MTPTTAFVSHPDCARHDTGWKHPEHQGRLPALVRAVYRDMLTLHGHLLEVEGRPATEDDLRLVHTDGLIRRVREACRAAGEQGEPRVLAGQVVVSGPSWEAARAAVGCALTGVETVMSGRVRNAFCAVRPPGYAAGADAVGGFSLFNSVAIAARHLRQRHGVERVLVVEWGGTAPGATSVLLADEPDEPGVRVLSVRQASGAAASADAAVVTLPPGTDGALFRAAFEAALTETLAGWVPQFVLLAAGFDTLVSDPLGSLSLEPADYHPLTRLLCAAAERHCAGRLVSVLEGGYDAAATGRAVVQHLRALADLDPVS
jgi:acetoin utilization deacetylase AcuC-like enzyme